jgi:UDP-N-acetylglucosamine--N-acetylmuramyl-(pentapeptide) pyrophosphoryl-undecaprenol N-acetylglucosamine transferase
MTKVKKILIATGGTGGHVFPAYSLANYFIKNDYIVSLTIDSRGLKYLKDNKNLNLVKIPSSPLIKKNILKFLFSIFVISFSILKSFIHLLFMKIILLLEKLIIIYYLLQKKYLFLIKTLKVFLINLIIKF